MNRSRNIIAFGLLSIAVGQTAEAIGQEHNTAQIERFEDNFSAALGRNDVATLEHLLAHDWKIISGDGGFITKARFLSVLSSGALKHDAMIFDARSIRQYGNVALVTEHVRSGGAYKGVAFHTDEVSTDTIVKMDGRWICVLTQLTTIAPNKD